MRLEPQDTTSLTRYTRKTQPFLVVGYECKFSLFTSAKTKTSKVSRDLQFNVPSETQSLVSKIYLESTYKVRKAA
ncbi:hypothetical protein B5X24_HaOG212353 [Helicoverpa armigera]|nr:hypothetical protein B5X24_HaOG212353 [Helicoverpa armigera]